MRDVDHEALEGAHARLGLLLLPHRGPHVRVDDVGAADRLHGIGRHLRRRGAFLLGVAHRALQDERVRLVALGRRHGHGDAQLGGAEHERVADVVAVAHVRQLQAVEPPALLGKGEEVGQRLARVELVGEPVDDGDGPVLREVDHVLVGEHAGHDPVHVAGEHLGGVRHRFAALELDRVAAQEDRGAAQLVHADLERHARAGRGLLEDHGQRLALERVPGSRPGAPSACARGRRSPRSRPASTPSATAGASVSWLLQSL